MFDRYGSQLVGLTYVVSLRVFSMVVFKDLADIGRRDRSCPTMNFAEGKEVEAIRGNFL